MTEGAISAAVGKAATGFLTDAGSWGDNNLNDFTRGVAVSMAGGLASKLAGGKFDNGATTAAFGYLFNCLASKCNANDYKGKSPGHEYGPFASPVLCNESTAGCMPAAQNALGCNSAPGQPACVPLGVDVAGSLSGANPVTQFRPNENMIINGTTDGHRYHDGMVMRWIGNDPNGDVRIWTYGIGINNSPYKAKENQVGGRLLFEKIGIENRFDVQKSLKR